MNKKVFDFNISKEFDGGMGYLVLKKENYTRDQILIYQVEMINNNTIPGLLELDIRDKDSQLQFYYKISALTDLKEYLNRDQVGKKELATILDGIIKIILDGNNFYLNDSSFVIDENFIYVNPKTLEVSLLYLPIESKVDPIYTFKSFIVGLLLNHNNINNEGEYIQELLINLKSEDFNLIELGSFLRKLKEDGIALPPRINEIKGYFNSDSAENESLDELTYTNSIDNIDDGQITNKDELGKNKRNTRTLVLGVIAVIAVLAAIVSNLVQSL